MIVCIPPSIRLSGYFTAHEITLLERFVAGEQVDQMMLDALRCRIATSTWDDMLKAAEANRMAPVMDMASFRINMAARAREARHEKPRRLAMARR